MTWLDELAADTAALTEAGRVRFLREITPLPGARAMLDGKIYLNFSSNDYMGIAGDAELRRRFYEQYPDCSTPELAQSSASSRLLTGNTPAYTRLEETLSKLYNNRAALVFNSGYHANIGILPALAHSGDLILSDKLNHASIIDGMRLCDAEFRRYPHLDLGQLEKQLAARRAAFRRVFLVTESVFSMDGDAADLARLVELKKKYDCILVVDEAHSVGVRGPRGTGLAAELGVADEVDVLIGTFGKAFGSTGDHGAGGEAVSGQSHASLHFHDRPAAGDPQLEPFRAGTLRRNGCKTGETAPDGAASARTFRGCHDARRLPDCPLPGGGGCRCRRRRRAVPEPRHSGLCHPPADRAGPYRASAFLALGRTG